MREILLPIGLVLFGLLLVASEAFIPSAGILGILAAASLIAGIVMAFYYGGALVGTVFMAVTAAVVTLLIRSMIKWWPKSAIGQKILVEPPKAEDLLVDRSEIKSMVGRYGKTLGLMVPGGIVEIDGKRFDALAETAVDPDTWVQVTKVTSGRILRVQPADEHEALQSRQPSTEADGEHPADDLFADPFSDS